jgi:acyl carrier protein
MDRTQVLAQLSAIMQEVLDDPNVNLTPATTADDVEGWDSMSNITFVVEVERRFGVKFNTAEIEEMRNVGDMLDIIAAKQAG